MYLIILSQLQIGVVTFSTEANTPPGSHHTNFPEYKCYGQSLGMATSQNNNYLAEYIHYTRGGGGTYYSKALEAAFNLINSTEAVEEDTRKTGVYNVYKKIKKLLLL